MILSLEKGALVEYVRNQLDHFFPDGRSSAEIEAHIDQVLNRVEYCFRAISGRYFRADAHETRFNHLNTDQYAMFLYLLSNTLFRDGTDPRLCEKVFYLNKLLNGVDVFYEVELPSIFCFCHPIGTVLGRAQYSDYFLVYQGCTIGAARELGSERNEYPILGKYVALYQGASVLGRCMIGDNCKIAANSLVLDQDVSDNQIYIGAPTQHILKENRAHDHIWDRRAG
jgi:serine O-acetyltransferase